MKKEPLLIAFASQKGGVGKSAFTVLVASILHYQKGLKVGVVDCDSPQHSISRMRDRDIESVQESDFLKVVLYRQHEQIRTRSSPVLNSNPESWNRVIQKAELHLLESRIPDTKRYNKELSSLKNSIFRSTLFPPDNRQIKGSGLCELIEELCAVTHLDASHTL